MSRLTFHDVAKFDVFCRSTIFLAGFLCAIGSAPAAESARGGTSPAAARLVEQALRAEAAGSTDRAELLQASLAESPGHSPTRWQSGYVRRKNQWLHVDRVPERTAENVQAALYRSRRDKMVSDGTWNTAEGQRQLAAFCSRVGLADQGRAHLTRLLEYTPDDADARRELGHVNVNGVWIDLQASRRGVERAEEARQALAKWAVRLEGIRRGLLGENDPRTVLIRGQPRLLMRGPGPTSVEAQSQWDAIDDPAAIPAMESVLSASGQARWSLMVVEKLEKMKSPEASVSLARHALVVARFVPPETRPPRPPTERLAPVPGVGIPAVESLTGWSEVRQRAVAALRSRPCEEYVPPLLAALWSPVQARAALYYSPDGRLVHQMTFAREGQELRELSVMERGYQYIPNPLGKPHAAVADALEATRREQSNASRAVAQQNAIGQELNDRICGVLSEATGEDLGQTPEAWWQWWNDYNEIFVAGEKPIRMSYQGGTVPVTGYRSPRSGGVSRSAAAVAAFGRATANALSQVRFDCLAAGTPVWTELGPVPVEQIQVGDRVLAQDVSTGELCYKPVLGTTIRPAGRLVRIEIAGEESFGASGGHRFWVSGQGWVKMRSIEADSLLHTVVGAAKVETVGLGEAEPTYNLIVADFHTFFVGRARVLSHDNTPVAPTDTVVPGLPGR